MGNQITQPGQKNLPHACKACGHSFYGDFCNQCGVKILKPQEKSFRYFLGSLLNAITFLDSKFLKTLKLMVLKPLSGHFIFGNHVNGLIATSELD